MDKQRFNLVLPKDEALPFDQKCKRAGVSKTALLRQFVRQYAKFSEVDFFVMPVIQAVALGRVMKEVSEQVRKEEG